MKGIHRGEDGGRMKHTWISSDLIDFSASWIGLSSNPRKNRTACEAKMQPWKKSERARGMTAWWQWRTGRPWCRFRSTAPGFVVAEPRSAAIWSAAGHRPAPAHCLDWGSAPPQWVLDALVVRLGGRHHARAQIRGQLSFVSSSRTTGRGHGLLHTLTGVATKQGGRGIPAGFSGGAAREKEESRRRAQIRKKYRGRRGVNTWDMETLGVGTVAGKQRAWWEKNRFWQKRSLNCDFLVLHSPSTLYPLLKTYDVWVRREGYGGPDLGEKSFQLFSLLIVY
jgi:hypothetical protein